MSWTRMVRAGSPRASVLAGAVAAALLVMAAPGTAAETDPAPGAADVVPGATEPTTPDDGWLVQTSPAGAVATWTSPELLPVTSARPEVTLDGEPVGPVVLGDDGRSVSATVPPGTDPSDLDVVLSGTVLDDAGSTEGARQGAGDRAAAGAGQGPDLGIDPGQPGPYTVTESDYQRPGLKVAGFPAALEVTGHVVAPAAGQGVTGKPLVLFLHGRHQFCYDPRDADAFPDAWPCAGGSRPVRSDLGYVYVQRLLAGQGYTTVSIAANGVNAQDYAAADGGAQARAALVRRHLDLWAQRAVTGSAGVDLDRVVLVGHSRGGEGVDLAAQEIPLSAPYRIAGELLLGPTDFARRTAAYVPTVTVLPYCDGDVSDLQGQLFTDTSRGLAPGDTALKSTVLVMGANHNFFNTEWTPGVSTAPSMDDWGDDQDPTCGPRASGRLTAAQQRQVGAAYVAGAVATFTHQGGSAPAELAMFDGTPGHVASAGPAVVRTHAVGGGRNLLLPARTTPIANGATARLCRGVAGGTGRSAAGDCAPDVDPGRSPHWAPADPAGLPTQSALRVAWTRTGAEGGVRTASPWDLSGAATLDLRVVAAPRTSARVDVRITDASGGTAVLTPTGGGQVPALPGSPDAGLAKLLAQQLRVPLSGLTGVDLARVQQVSLVSRSASGTVWLLDLAGTPAGLPAVPARRLPLLQVGDVRTTETGTGARAAQVPWRVTGDTSRSSTFRLVSNDFTGKQTVTTVTVPAGRTSGSIAVPYRGDRVYTGTRYASVAAFPVSGLGIDDGNGQVELRDDEKAPAVRVRVPRVVQEGEPIRVTVTLAEPVGINVTAQPSFVRPPRGPRAGVADLPKRWVRRTTYADTPRAPLWERYLAVDGNIDPGKRTVTMTIPTRADGVREGDERVRLKIEVAGLEFATTRDLVIRDR